jgi:hypothetical protein
MFGAGINASCPTPSLLVITRTTTFENKKI